jgi:predicted transcriptional regulator
MENEQSDVLEQELRSELHRLLSDRDRRELLAWLAEQENSQPSLSDLVDAVAKDSSEAERRRVRTTLYHVHLPMLEEADVLQYDPDRQRIVNMDVDHRAVQAPVGSG